MSNNKNNNILDRNVDVEPTGVIYKIKGSTVEEFVEKYLSLKNVTGVGRVKVRVQRTSRNDHEVAIYLFMHNDSKFITTETPYIAPMLRDKMDNKANLKLSKDFRDILVPMCGEHIECGKRSNMFFVKLDIFRVVGMMFKVNPNCHAVAIPSAANISGDDSVISVIKEEKFNTYGNKPVDDKYSRMVADLERRH